MDAENIKTFTNAGVGAAFGVVCLFTLIWVVKFVLSRVEVAIKENTEAIKGLLGYFKSHNMYISGGKDAE
jgi:hypothetical protein